MNPNLINAVIRQLGYSEDDLDQTSVEYNDLTGTLKDIYHHGIGGGYHGFIYYRETFDFYRSNRHLILEQLNDEIDNGIGYSSAVEMVANFLCAADHNHDEIGQALYGPTSDADDQIANCLSWYAAEEVARCITAAIDDGDDLNDWIKTNGAAA